MDSTLEFSPVLLRASATNFTEVATLACRGTFQWQGREILGLFAVYGNNVDILKEKENLQIALDISSSNYSHTPTTRKLSYVISFPILLMS